MENPSRRQFLQTTGLASILSLFSSRPEPIQDKTARQFNQDFNQATQAGIRLNQAKDLYHAYEKTHKKYNNVLVATVLEFESLAKRARKSGTYNPCAIIKGMTDYMHSR